MLATILFYYNRFWNTIATIEPKICKPSLPFCFIVLAGVVAFAGSAFYFYTNVNMNPAPKHLLRNN